ncbi:hypothetical protein BB932_27635 [Klebsiella pneumoniae]|nr:hypothetical protein BB932_27635 [Klebsiella pneumoniae]
MAYQWNSAEPGVMGPNRLSFWGQGGAGKGKNRSKPRGAVPNKRGGMAAVGVNGFSEPRNKALKGEWWKTNNPWGANGMAGGE